MTWAACRKRLPAIGLALLTMLAGLDVSNALPILPYVPKWVGGVVLFVCAIVAPCCKSVLPGGHTEGQ